MLALGCAAARRGHDVVVSAAPGYAANVARAGLEFQPLRPAIPEDAESLAYYFDMKRGPRRLLRDMIFQDVAATLKTCAKRPAERIYWWWASCCIRRQLQRLGKEFHG